MQVAQQLYEGVDIEGRGTLGLISYIRTDSVRLSDEAVAAAREMIAERYGEQFVPEKPNVYKGRKSAQDAHEAIRPTNLELRPEDIKASLTKDNITSIGWSICALSPARWRTRCMKPSRLKSLRIRALCFAQVLSGSSLPALPPSMKRARTTRRIRMNTAAA